MLFRLGFGGMMLTHGIPKLMKLISGDFSFGDPIGIGAPASLVLATFGELVFPIIGYHRFQTPFGSHSSNCYHANRRLYSARQ